MAVTVHLPAALHSLTRGATQTTVIAATVGEAIEQLEAQYPGIRDTLLDGHGVRRFVSLCIGDRDIRFLDGLDTRLGEGDELSIFQALAGG